MADGLSERYPEIPWREPILVGVLGGVERLCCRICIARSGIRGSEVAEKGFETREEFDRHMAERHAE